MNAKALLRLTAAALPLLASGALLAQGFAGMGRDTSGFAEVKPNRAFSFPKDHGPHPGYRTEWWYVTANLTDADGASYGAQWTLFRQALEPGVEKDGWRSQILWMAHAAITTNREHLFAERFARGGIGQAGVRAEPFLAHLDNWTLAAQGEGFAKLDVRAEAPDFGYALTLASDRPVVLQGDGGFSRKSPQGQASDYYSQPFFEVTGALDLHGRDIKVSGHAWLDREWTSQYLAADQKGWDWFALHLANGEKVMLFRMRNDKAGVFRSGTWISAEGAPQPLSGEEISLEPMTTSEIAGRRLPTRWRIAIPSRGLAIETAPLNPASWMATSFPYWEGPIRFQGSHQGEGYLEMTGY